MNGGPEGWHPGPEFFYRKGAGPVFDMGPLGRNTTGKRVIGSGPRKGTEFDAEVLTFVAALLEFRSGPLVTFISSFDVVGHEHPPIEIYGTEGTLQVPDPNYFGGTVRVIRKGGAMVRRGALSQFWRRKSSRPWACRYGCIAGDWRRSSRLGSARFSCTRSFARLC
jgi:predicted dehydrogenase